MVAVGLSALRAGRPAPPGRFLVFMRNIQYEVHVDENFPSKQNSLNNVTAFTVQLFNLTIEYAIMKA
jgi:hypothetical protein